MDQSIRDAGLKISVYLFLAALAMRLVFLCQYASSPFFWVPSLDALYHDLLARAIAAGRPDHHAFFRAPLYYYFLGGVYRLFGHSFWAARVTQAVIGSGSCVLVYRIGLRVFRPSVGLLATAMMALYGPLIFFDGELLTPVLEVFLDLVFLLLALRAMKSRSRWEWLGAGLVLGLAAITRPNILVVTPVALVWMWARGTSPPAPPLQGEGGQRRGGFPGKRDPYRPPRLRGRGRATGAAAGLFLAGAGLAPALVTFRNYQVSGDPVFIASQGGINLYLGNRPAADGFTPSTPQRFRFAGPYEDSVALYGQRAAEEAAGRPLSASAAQAYWVRRVLQWWREAPVDALKLTAKKVVLAWSRREIRNNHAYDFVRGEFAPCLWFCPAGFWFAGPMGLFGMALAFRAASRGDACRIQELASSRALTPGPSPNAGRGEDLSLPPSPSIGRGGQGVRARPHDVRFLACYVLLYVGSFVPFFVADRYRLPVVPVLLLFGADALIRIGEWLRGRDWRRLAPAGLALAALTVFVNVDWYPTVTPDTWALDYWSAGNGYQAMGRLPEAESEHRKALRLDPCDPELWTNLGVDQYGVGRIREAAHSFQQALTLGPRSGTADYDLAMCELQLNRPEQACQHLKEAVRVDPEYARARLELARLEIRRHTPTAWVPADARRQ